MSSLNTFLDRAQRFGPEYSGRLSNHLPMALVALHALGANDEQMERGFAFASRRLEPAPAEAAACADWAALRGQPDAFAAIRAVFLDDIRRRGADAVVRGALPLLIDGAGGSAFHGLLRTASAITARYDKELAAGLAYWACVYMPLIYSNDENEPGTADLRAWLAALGAATSDWTNSAGLISDRMLSYSHTPGFQLHANRIVASHSTLRELATIALEHYLRSRNFTVLHLITGTHAMRKLLPHVDDVPVAMKHYAMAFAAGVAASRIDTSAAPLPATIRPWNELTAMARSTTDEHVVKLIYACREEFQVTGDDRYRAAASLVAG